MRFKIPSDETIIEFSHKDSNGNMVFIYLKSETKKNKLSLSMEQLETAIRKEIFKKITE